MVWATVSHGGNSDIHVVPLADFIEHEHNKNCVCLPKAEGVPTGRRSVRWMYSHSALDGREERE